MKIKATEPRNSKYQDKIFDVISYDGHKMIIKIGKFEYWGCRTKYDEKWDRGYHTIQEQALATIDSPCHGICFHKVESNGHGNLWFDRFDIIED